MCSMDYSERKNNRDGVSCLDANSDEYISMDEMQEVYAEMQNRDHEKNAYSSPRGVKNLAKDYAACISSSRKQDNGTHVYSDPNIQKKVNWHWSYKNYLGYILYAITYLTLLVIVLVLAVVILAKMITFESSLRNTFCDRSLTIESLPEFLSSSQGLLAGYCDLEQRKFRKYQILNADLMSCSDVLYQNSSAESGYYLLRSHTGQLTSVFCDMTRTCGNITGGWMRIAELDVASCPMGLKSKTFNNTQTCVVNEDAPGCTSVSFNSFGIPFSKICGKIRGYGIGTIDGMYRERWRRGNNVTDNYLDGVSLTTGETHVWSFVAGGCVCDYTKPFITNDWTCDEPTRTPDISSINYLWNNTLCGKSTPFLKQFPSIFMNGGINMRVCRDEDRDNEDIALSNVELYVY